MIACQQPTFASKDFLLLRNKMKKTNSSKDVDPLMKNALETGLKPHFSQLADEIQREQSQ